MAPASILDPDLVAELVHNPTTCRAARAFLDAWAAATSDGATPANITAAAEAAWDHAVAEQRQAQES